MTTGRRTDHLDDSGEVSRRKFLASGLAVAGSAAVPGALARTAAAAPVVRAARAPTVLVIVNLSGGNDGLNTVVPLTLQSYFDRRPTIAVDPATAVGLNRGPAPSTTIGLHPSMVQLGDLWELGELAVVQRVGYPQPSLSHFSSTDIWSQGYRDPGSVTGQSGWIARFKDLYARETLGVVGIGTKRLLDFRGGETPSLVVDSIEDFGFALDQRYQANSKYRNLIVQRVLDMNRIEGAAKEVRDVSSRAYGMIESMQNAGASYQGTAVYPENRLGRVLRDAAVLLSTEFPSRIVYVKTGGYDTHSRQAGRHANLLGDLDAALGAFATDLRQIGAWSRVVVAVISEFGRRTDENGSNGTDHGSGSVALLLGGAVRGGAYGPELTEQDLLDKHLAWAVDFRALYWEIHEKHLGVDPNPVFPENTSINSLGVL